MHAGKWVSIWVRSPSQSCSTFHFERTAPRLPIICRYELRMKPGLTRSGPVWRPTPVGNGWPGTPFAEKTWTLNRLPWYFNRVSGLPLVVSFHEPVTVPNNMSTSLIFSGTSKSECESFVHAVRNHARAAGRSRDNDWIVDFVAACFLGDALHWYEELGPRVQNDWDLLRKAILGWRLADTSDSEDEIETYVQQLVL